MLNYVDCGYYSVLLERWNKNRMFSKLKLNDLIQQLSQCSFKISKYKLIKLFQFSSNMFINVYIYEEMEICFPSWLCYVLE